MSPLISEEKVGLPILIVDRLGIFGEALAKKLHEDSTVVLVTNKEPPSLDNLLYIPFEKEIPKIPDNTYSHIFVVDDGREITIEFLSSFLNKARSDKAIFCFCTTLDNQENIPEEFFEYRKSKTVFLGDIFPAKEQFSKSYINRFINSAKNRGKINVPQDGMAISYPLFFEDAILGILEASFGTSSDKTYFILPKHGITLLSLAHMIQKNDPNIKIDFSNEKPSEILIQKEGKYVLPENYPLEDRLKNLKINASRFEKKVKENLQEQKEWSPQKSSSVDFKILLFSFIFFLFLPLLTTLIFSFIAFLSLDMAKTMSNNSKYFLSLSKLTFSLADDFSRPLIYETGFFGIDPLSKLTQSIRKGELEVNEISDYYNALNFFAQGNTSGAIASIKNFLITSSGDESLKILNSGELNFISQTINIWPQILALGSKKTYLVIIQNNFIPRGTGGEIQAFGFLTFDNGRFSDFSIHNTNDSDKNLKGHVEPPFPLRRFLKTKDLFMKDSNFNPDFGQSATSAAFFASLEGGENTDGVIAIDLNTIQKLKQLLREGDAANFFDEAKEQMNNPLFLENSVLNILKDLKKENSSAIFLSSDLIKLIETKHVIFYFNDPSIENIFATNDFSSTLMDDRTSSPKEIDDFVSPVEADLGAPVENVQRSLTDKVNISQDGGLSSDLSIEYKNYGSNSYKNYLRFIVPAGATLTKIKIDGKDTEFTNAITDPSIYEAPDFIPPQKLEVESYSQNGKTIFGFLITIPKGNSKTVEIIYNFGTLPRLSALSDFLYNLKFFKQPGIDPYPFNFSIIYPSSFKTSSKTSFSTSTEKDFDLSLNFSQK